jgi:hypothetical protein
MDKEMRTTELALAAYLATHGHKPVRFEMMNSRSATWVYENSDGIEKLFEDFHDGCAEVEPRAFMHCLSSTRRELFAFLDGDAS